MIQVSSEVGRLRQVLVHEPGPEVDSMVPSMMEELLFDDILFGDRAREEHRRFKRTLNLLGVETVDAARLLAEALGQEGAQAWMLEILLEDVPELLRPRLLELPAEQLAQALIAGVRREEQPTGVEVEDLFLVPPLPNHCFQRDPQVVLQDGVLYAAMATPARYREALLARAVFRFHPRFAGARTVLDPLHPEHNPLLLGVHRPCIEGGDVEVLSPDVVLVGHSERTNRTGIQYLIRALSRMEGGPRWLITAQLPRRRAYMHLDTVMTLVDRDACLVHEPVILEGGLEQARVFEVDLHSKDPQPRALDGLLHALAGKGIDLEPIACGGSDALDQQREQWTDGANALALAPGVIVLYDRNVRTIEELGRRGFRSVSADDLLLGRDEVDIDNCGRTCILWSSHELARARGGPHCLTHALVRDGL
jgi:arginine deiminase